MERQARRTSSSSPSVANVRDSKTEAFDDVDAYDWDEYRSKAAASAALEARDEAAMALELNAGSDPEQRAEHECHSSTVTPAT